MTLLSELKRKAEAATPGPWEQCRHWRRAIHKAGNCSGEFPIEALDPNDAAFIAAFNPQTALKLIEAVEIARDALEKSGHPNRYHGPCSHCGPLASEVGSYISRAALARVDALLGGGDER